MRHRLRRISLTILTVAAICIAAVCLCACKKTTVIDKYYYLYDYDLASDTGRNIAEQYKGVAVTIKANCKYTTYGAPLGTGSSRDYHPVSGAIISADGYVVTTYHGVRGGNENSVLSSDKYTYKVYLSRSESYDSTAVEEYEADYIEGWNNSDVALLKLRGAKSLNYADLSDFSDATVGDSAYMMYCYDNRGSIKACPIMASAAVGATGEDSVKYLSAMPIDYVPRKFKIDVVAGEYPACSVGGIIVGSDGKVTGMNFTRLLSQDKHNSQEQDIYGLAAAIPAHTLYNLCSPYLDKKGV